MSSLAIHPLIETLWLRDLFRGDSGGSLPTHIGILAPLPPLLRGTKNLNKKWHAPLRLAKMAAEPSRRTLAEPWRGTGLRLGKRMARRVVARHPSLQLHLLKDVFWNVDDDSHDEAPEERRVHYRLAALHRPMNPFPNCLR
jgi:hypothetical protein